jgi:hypothetical protein
VAVKKVLQKLIAFRVSSGVHRSGTKEKNIQRVYVLLPSFKAGLAYRRGATVGEIRFVVKKDIVSSGDVLNTT